MSVVSHKLDISITFSPKTKGSSGKREKKNCKSQMSGQEGNGVFWTQQDLHTHKLTSTVIVIVYTRASQSTFQHRGREGAAHESPP